MGEPNWANRTLFHGDNLEFLRGMNSETVHLIATDPPFKKGRDFHATPDSLASGAKFQDRWKWERDTHEEWHDAIQNDYPAAWAVIDWSRMTCGDDMGAFLCFMGVRLMEMRRILREDGSLYLHCDPTASHYLKNLLDAIFGKRYFRNEIVWCYPPTGAPPKIGFPRKHDIILFYSKSRTATFTTQYGPMTEATRKSYSSVDEHGRRYSKAHGGVTYLDEVKGRAVPSWWDDCGSGSTMPKRERSGYPTQKPLALYKRIIRASSNEGDIVLDPFCGCATTPIAAERLGRRWVGVDLWDGAHGQVIERLERQGLAGPERTPERLLTFGDVTCTTEPPERTDDGEEAAPALYTPSQRALARWQRLSRKEIADHLADAQGDLEGVVCGGCGRKLEREFMQLDHIQPRSDRGENFITNRILLCHPCNGRKSDRFTLRGLMRENRKAGWMRDAGLARIAQESAQARAERIRAELT